MAINWWTTSLQQKIFEKKQDVIFTFGLGLRVAIRSITETCQSQNRPTTSRSNTPVATPTPSPRKVTAHSATQGDAAAALNTAWQRHTNKDRTKGHLERTETMPAVRDTPSPPLGPSPSHIHKEILPNRLRSQDECAAATKPKIFSFNCLRRWHWSGLQVALSPMQD